MWTGQIQSLWSCERTQWANNGFWWSCKYGGGVYSFKIVFNAPTYTESENRPSNSTSTSSQNNPSQEQASLSNHNPVPSDDVYNFNENFELPPFPDGFASSSDDNNDSENDQIDYLLESDDDDDEIPQIRVPLENYRWDLEHKFNFSNNWMWTEEDPGSSYGPFNGNPGLNIQPHSNDPIDFFRLFFEDSMFTRIANETNNYARQRIRNRTGYWYFFVMYWNSNLKLFFNNSHILKYSDLSINISDIYIYRSIFRIVFFYRRTGSYRASRLTWVSQTP